MRKLIALLIVCLAFLGCSKKEESRLEKIEAEKNKQKQNEAREIGTTAPDSVPQRGFDALRDIKELRQEEHDRQEVEKEMIDQVDKGE